MSNTTEDNYLSPPRPSRSLRGKVAIVTGAGCKGPGLGNGRAAAILLAEAGAQVVCSDIHLDRANFTLELITKEFGEGRAVAVQVDVSKEEDCKNAVQVALTTFGRLDIVVNNVGPVGAVGTAVDVDPTEWANTFAVNVTGVMLMSKYAIPAMEKNELVGIGGRGSIINISSIGGLLGGVPNMLAFSTTKGALLNLTRSMAVHHGPRGIRVNSVIPGLLFTPMVYIRGITPERREIRVRSNLLKTEGNAWDCGAAVRFLASEEARWVTGSALVVDGGTTATFSSSTAEVTALVTSTE